MNTSDTIGRILSHRRLLRAGIPAAFFVIGLIAYANSFRCPFIFDDAVSILENPDIRHLWPPTEIIFSPLKTTVTGRPTAALSLAVNYAISGYSVWSYHIFNLIIHVLAGLTLYGIIRRTLLSGRLKDRFGSRATIIASAAATIWLVHPIQTESVTYIVQRTESIMGLFYLLTLYTAIRAMESQRSAGWSAMSITCCALGMASKEVMVTAPLLVLLYDRTFAAGTFTAALRRRRSLYIALAATWIILIAIMSTGPRASSAGFGLKKITPWQYAGTQFEVIVNYLKLSFWPSGLCLDYNWPIAEGWRQITPPMLFIVFLLAVTFWGLFRNFTWSYPAAWLFFILFPTSGFVPIADLAFEHRMYLPIVGLVTLLVTFGYMVAGHLAKQFRIYRAYYIALTLTVVIIIALTCATINRNKDYQSVLSIWQSVLKISPDNARAHNNIGLALRGQDKVDEAISHYRRSIQLNPDYADAYNNMGVALQFQDKLDEAADCYNKTLLIDPDYTKAYNSLGIIMAKQGKTDQAVGYFRKAVSLDREYTDAYLNLGKALTLQGKFDEAIACYLQLLQIEPDEVVPLTTAAWLLAGHPDPKLLNAAQAIAFATRAAMLTNYQDASVLSTLAAAYAADNQFDLAVETAQKALQLASALKQDRLINYTRKQLGLYIQAKQSSLR